MPDHVGHDGMSGVRYTRLARYDNVSVEEMKGVLEGRMGVGMEGGGV